MVSLDDGAPRPLPEALVPRCLLALAGGRALVGSSEARLVLVGSTDGPAVDRAFDAIPTRREWTTPWGAPPDLRSLTMGDAGLFAGVHVGGVWRRDPDQWIEVVPAEADDHQVLAEGDTVAVAAAIGVGPELRRREHLALEHRGAPRRVLPGGGPLRRMAAGQRLDRARHP